MAKGVILSQLEPDLKVMKQGEIIYLKSEQEIR